MSVNVPQLPGSPHIVTLVYLLGILALAALVVYLWLQFSGRRQET